MTEKDIIQKKNFHNIWMSLNIYRIKFMYSVY
jgi:hypothetical protein